MSQAIWSTIVPSTTSGNQLATLLNNFKAAVVTGLSGTSRPTELGAGGSWVDTTNATIWYYKLFDGAQDITIFAINKDTGSASIFSADSQFAITKTTDDTVGPILKLLKKRIASNGQVLSGDALGVLEFYGTKDNGDEVLMAKIKSVATDNVTASAQGSILVFECITDGTTSFAEVMRLVDGKLALGRVTAGEKLDVQGNAKVRNLSDSADGAEVVYSKSRVSALGAVLSGDMIAKDKFLCVDDAGTEFESGATELITVEAQTPTARGNKTSFKGIKSGTSTKITKFELGDTAVFNISLTNPSMQDATVETGYFQYFGDSSTNGSRRFGVVSGDFVLQERVAGVWTTNTNFGSN